MTLSLPRVLFLDDNVEIARLYCLSLNQIPSICVAEATFSAQEALQKVRMAHAEGVPFALIVSDIAMPAASGFEFGDALRAWEREAGIGPTPLVFLTAYTEAENAARAQSLGAVTVLEKPAFITTLRDNVSAIVKSSCS